MKWIRSLWRRWFGTPDPEPKAFTLTVAEARAEELLQRPGLPWDRLARDTLAALLYTAHLVGGDNEQVRTWIRMSSSEPVEVLRERISGEAEDPDARKALHALVVQAQSPDRTRPLIDYAMLHVLDNSNPRNPAHARDENEGR